MATRNLRRIVSMYAPEGISPHKVRHSYASELYKQSHDLQLVQETLGHSSIQTTQDYIHTDVEDRRKAYRQYFPRVTILETQQRNKGDIPRGGYNVYARPYSRRRR